MSSSTSFGRKGGIIKLTGTNGCAKIKSAANGRTLAMTQARSTPLRLVAQGEPGDWYRLKNSASLGTLPCRVARIAWLAES